MAVAIKLTNNGSTFQRALVDSKLEDLLRVAAERGFRGTPTVTDAEGDRMEIRNTADFREAVNAAAAVGVVLKVAFIEEGEKSGIRCRTRIPRQRHMDGGAPRAWPRRARALPPLPPATCRRFPRSLPPLLAAAAASADVSGSGADSRDAKIKASFFAMLDEAVAKATATFEESLGSALPAAPGQSAAGGHRVPKWSPGLVQCLLGRQARSQAPFEASRAALSAG